MTTTFGDLTHAVSCESALVPASEVRVGDVVVLDGYVVTIATVNKARVGYEYGPTWGDAVHFIAAGLFGFVRFSQEQLRVVRPAGNDRRQEQ